MKALEPTKRLIERYATAQDEVCELAAKLNDAQNHWEAAVTADDPKAEHVASKALATAQDALTTARARLPLLAEAITNARRDCLPEHAQETALTLRELNERALPLAARLLEAYETARAAAMRINVLHKEHAEHARRHFTLCKQCGVPPVPFPRDARFAVEVSHMNATFRPDAEERFRLTAEKLYRTEKGASHAVNE